MKIEKLSMSEDSDGSCTEDETSYNVLRQHHWERCEFCDKLCSNRYAMLKHNVSHIIIPLIQQTTHQCIECLHHFTSIEDLAKHTADRHRTAPNSELNGKGPEILKSIIDKQVIVKCEDELKEVMSKCKELNSNGTELYENGLTDSCGCSELIKTEPSSPNSSSVTDTPSSPIDNEKASICQRLMYEEDIEDTLFKKFSAEYHISLEKIFNQTGPDKPVMPLSETANLGTIETQNNASRLEIMPGTFNTVNFLPDDATDLLRYGKAIHYDALTEPEVWHCRWCKKEFPNRFKLLQHEPIHITMRSKRKWPWPLCCVCERYISGNYRTLRMHMEKNHPDKLDVNFRVQKCPKCHLRYHNFDRHCGNHHEAYRCSICQLGFETSQQRDGHSCSKVDCMLKTVPSDVINNSTDTYKTVSYRDSFEPMHDAVKSTVFRQNSSCLMKLCDLCFSFMKIYIQNRQNYEVVGELSEVGVRQICDKCNNKFFEVNLVKRKQILKDVPKKFKSSNNTERLKKIQCRLKMMKDRNKY